MVETNPKVWGKTHPGCKRKKNEDRFLIKEMPDITLLVVADGVSGNFSGEIAAQIVVDVFKEYPFSKENLDEGLNMALATADKRIHQRVGRNPELEYMGTTASIAAVCKKKTFWIHVGDSRIYLLHDKELKQITTDHTFIQDFIDDGSLNPDQAKVHPLRNMLDQCVGCDEIEPETGVLDLSENDQLLLCSDGLTTHLSDEEIASIIKTMPIRDAGEKLIQTALEMGGIDNVTVIVRAV